VEKKGAIPHEQLVEKTTRPKSRGKILSPGGKETRKRKGSIMAKKDLWNTRQKGEKSMKGKVWNGKTKWHKKTASNGPHKFQIIGGGCRKHARPARGFGGGSGRFQGDCTGKKKGGKRVLLRGAPPEGRMYR